MQCKHMLTDLNVFFLQIYPDPLCSSSLLSFLGRMSPTLQQETGKSHLLQRWDFTSRPILFTWIFYSVTWLQFSSAWYIIKLLTDDPYIACMYRWWAAWTLIPAGTVLQCGSRGPDRKLSRTWPPWCESFWFSSTNLPATNRPGSSSTGMECQRDSSDR